MIKIEFCDTRINPVVLQAFTVPEKTTVQEALQLILTKSYDLQQLSVGLWGRVVFEETILQTGDRLEIYQALAQDPKVARRKRAHLHSRLRFKNPS